MWMSGEELSSRGNSRCREAHRRQRGCWACTVARHRAWGSKMGPRAAVGVGVAWPCRAVVLSGCRTAPWGHLGKSWGNLIITFKGQCYYDLAGGPEGGPSSCDMQDCPTQQGTDPRPTQVSNVLLDVCVDGEKSVSNYFSVEHYYKHKVC